MVLLLPLSRTTRVCGNFVERVEPSRRSGHVEQRGLAHIAAVSCAASLCGSADCVSGGANRVRGGAARGVAGCWRNTCSQESPGSACVVSRQTPASRSDLGMANDGGNALTPAVSRSDADDVVKRDSPGLSLLLITLIRLRCTPPLPVSLCPRCPVCPRPPGPLGGVGLRKGAWRVLPAFKRPFGARKSTRMRGRCHQLERACTPGSSGAVDTGIPRSACKHTRGLHARADTFPGQAQDDAVRAGIYGGRVPLSAGSRACRFLQHPHVMSFMAHGLWGHTPEQRERREPESCCCGNHGTFPRPGTLPASTCRPQHPISRSLSLSLTVHMVSRSPNKPSSWNACSCLVSTCFRSSCISLASRSPCPLCVAPIVCDARTALVRFRRQKKKRAS